MLVPKPFIVAYKNKKKKEEQNSIIELDEHKE
jgi:hypothetical protein